MIKRPHCCALMLGVGLLLLAAAFVVRLNLLQGHDHTAVQIARVAQTVTDLQGGGCLTCHNTLAGSSDVLVSLRGDTTPTQPVSEALARADAHDASASSHERVNAQLLDQGQRILALAETRSDPDDAVVSAYLEVYEDARQMAASGEVWAGQTLLGHLDRVEALLRDWEHQASPVRLRARDGATAPLPAPVLSSAPAVPIAVAVSQRALLGQADWPDCWLIGESHDLAMPVELAYAVQRRGPPARLLFDSVWYGRLHSTDTQSPFILSGRACRVLA